MTSLSGLLRKAQRERAAMLGTTAPAVDQQQIREADRVRREQILADEELRTRIARQRAIQSWLLWQRCARWTLLVGFVALFTATTTALAIAWSHEQTAAAVTAATAIAGQVALAVFATIKQALLHTESEEPVEGTGTEEDEAGARQLTLVLNDA